jgi:hypothetical protein
MAGAVNITLIAGRSGAWHSAKLWQERVDAARIIARHSFRSSSYFPFSLSDATHAMAARTSPPPQRKTSERIRQNGPRRPNGVEVLYQVCESLEGGRWEGFVSLKAARKAGVPISIREAYGWR